MASPERGAAASSNQRDDGAEPKRRADAEPSKNRGHTTKPKRRAEAALPLGPRELPELVRRRVITDPVAIKALADPLRLRIMGLMQKGAQEQPRTFTVKQIAAELGEPATKLYRHIKTLLGVELIQVAEVRLVGGIVEQHYRAAQVGLTINPEAAGGSTEEIIEVAGVAIDEFLNDHRAAIQSGRTFLQEQESLAHPPHVRSVGAVISSTKLPPAKAKDFAERLAALVDEFAAYESEEDGVEANLLTIFYATE
jgi:DNA-binding transcriptional ArsR family regulator